MKNTLDYLSIPCLLTDESLHIIDANSMAEQVFGRAIQPDAFSQSNKLITRIIKSNLANFLQWIESDDNSKKPILLDIQTLHKNQKYLVSHNKHQINEKTTFFFTFSFVSQSLNSDSRSELYRQAFEYSNQSIYLRKMRISPAHETIHF